jgi:mannose-6-phosphate isomerase-like protein (cupin superfamily)
MAVELEGGCRVTHFREGDPAGAGTLRLWQQVGRATGARAISLRTLEFAPGRSPGLANASSDEVLFALEGEATVYVDGWPHRVGPDTGVFVRPGEVLTVDNPGPGAFVLLSSRCPEPAAAFETVAARVEPEPGARAPEPPPVVRLADRKALPTADRWYRVLVDDEVGSAQVTQFVGSIPPGRAPDHFHRYEEVLFILRGEGRMWAGATSTPIAPGSCVYLPNGQVHCVENTGAGELRLLGVFYPAGSPAVRYDAE